MDGVRVIIDDVRAMLATTADWIPFDSTLLSGLIAAAATLIIAVFFQRYLVLESIWKSDTSLNISVTTKLIELSKRRDRAILETRIDAHNNSRQPCCIVGAYVSSRALISPSRPIYKHTTQFDELEYCGDLSEVADVSYVPRSVIQITPDETESFVRWDTISLDFMKSYPVIVINVEVFATRQKHVGMSLRKSKVGKLRNKWIAYIEKMRNAEQRFMVFSRWTTSGSKRKPFKPNDRYIVDAKGNPDFESSKHFRPMLKNMVQWSRHVTVDFRLRSD